jgi:hypothetical protein
MRGHKKRGEVRNFIIFYNGKEGSTPLVRTLDNFEQIHIVRQGEGMAWEPFDPHASGEIIDDDLVRCMDLIFSPEPVFLDALNEVYMKTARHPLSYFDKTVPVGFKMRYAKRSAECLRKIFSILRRNNVVAFVNIRKDILRWALSRYHGDGSGKGKGHLQFDLAAGRITREEIPILTVDLKKLKDHIDKCTRINSQKISLLKDLADFGIESSPLYYEDFCGRRREFFERMLSGLGLKISDKEMIETLGKEMPLKKVHSDDISTFVENYKEVLQRYGDLS